MAPNNVSDVYDEVTPAMTPPSISTTEGNGTLRALEGVRMFDENGRSCRLCATWHIGRGGGAW